MDLAERLNHTEGALLSNERVVAAVYGHGRDFLHAAERAGRRREPEGPRYREAYRNAVADRDGFGRAAALTANGVVALTTRRLLLLVTPTPIDIPDAVSVEIDRDEVIDIAYSPPMLTIAFSDGSVAGFHVAATQRPQELVIAVTPPTSPARPQADR